VSEAKDPLASVSAIRQKIRYFLLRDFIDSNTIICESITIYDKSSDFVALLAEYFLKIGIKPKFFL
jgi:hypothetical protein